MLLACCFVVRISRLELVLEIAEKTSLPLNADADFPFLRSLVPAHSGVNAGGSLGLSVDVAVIFSSATSKKIPTPIIETVTRNMIRMVLPCNKLLNIDGLAVDVGARITVMKIPVMEYDPVVVVDGHEKIFAKMYAS